MDSVLKHNLPDFAIFEKVCIPLALSWSWPVCVCVCVCMCVCERECVCVKERERARKQRAHAYMSAHTHTHTRARTHTHGGRRAERKQVAYYIQDKDLLLGERTYLTIRRTIERTLTRERTLTIVRTLCQARTILCSHHYMLVPPYACNHPLRYYTCSWANERDPRRL